MDGPSKRPAPNGSMPINVVTDIVLYMYTNNLGMNGGAANSAVGTTISNIYNGLVNFYGYVGWKNIIGMAYNKYTPQFLGTANEYPEFWKSQGYNNTISLDKDVFLLTIQHEIDNNRPVIGCYKGWSLTSTGDAPLIFTGEQETEANYYKFGPFNATNELTGEAYTENVYSENIGSALGHSVLII